MKTWGVRGLIALTLMMGAAQIGNCESLFVMGTSQTYYAEPKSLFGCVRARSVGDLVTIILSENIAISDSLQYGSERKANTVDNFTNFLNSFFPGRWFNPNINNFGGSNTVDSTSNNQRAMKMQDSVTAQVVQVLPNGNLMIQGKKTLVNANERVDLLISGVVDPRCINDAGQINSRSVANLQFALNGKGVTSRAAQEGVVNRAVKYLF